MAINLSALRKTSIIRPPRIVLYGTHGVGKSTFAAAAENPVFIQTEEGLDALNVTAFPLARSYEEVMDSADWLEQLIWKKVAENHKVSSLEDIGYGKGYIYAIDLWRDILEGFDLLRNEHEMQVMFLAHTQIRRFDDPLADSYDRYMLDLHKGAASIISEWCDILAFANYQLATIQQDVGFDKKKTRAIGTGTRVLHTQERPGWVAKSRWPLPETMPLNYTEVSNALADAMTPQDETKQGDS